MNKTLFLSLAFVGMTSMIFAQPGQRAPQQLVDKNNIIAKGAEVIKAGEGYSFTEGPAVDAKGNVFFTDQPNNKIYRWDAKTKEITVFTDQSGRANGTYFDKKGNLISCSDMDNQVWAFDKKGNAKVLVKNYEGKLLNGPNDVWVNPKDGSMYFSDPYFRRNYWTRNPDRQQPVEGLYYLAPGASEFVMVDNQLDQPNGLVGSPDGKKLYVAEAKANKIWVYDIQADGSLTNKTLFANAGSDGMTIDNQGNIYTVGRGVTVFDKNGEQIAQIPINEGWTSNVCFGGKNRNILFITASKSVYTVEMNVNGVK